jgi:hypothetical protein
MDVCQCRTRAPGRLQSNGNGAEEAGLSLPLRCYGSLVLSHSMSACNLLISK